jgi:hypothetical protein
VELDAKINRSRISLAEPSLSLAMKEEAFSRFFPHLFTFIVFSKLIDGTSRTLGYKDYGTVIPMKLARAWSTPTLKYDKPYISFIKRANFYDTRRGLAARLETLEIYEKAFKKQAKKSVIK